MTPNTNFSGDLSNVIKPFSLSLSWESSTEYWSLHNLSMVVAPLTLRGSVKPKSDSMTHQCQLIQAVTVIFIFIYCNNSANTVFISYFSHNNLCIKQTVMGCLFPVTFQLTSKQVRVDYEVPQLETESPHEQKSSMAASVNMAPLLMTGLLIVFFTLVSQLINNIFINSLDIHI